MLLRSCSRKGSSRAAIAVVGFATSFIAPLGARASGLDVPAIGSANSSPTTADAAAIYWNPGMLGYLERSEFFGGVGVVGGRIGYTRERRGVYAFEDSLNLRDPIDPEVVDLSKTGIADPVSSPVFSPWADAFGTFVVIPDRLNVGLGFYVPYAAPLNFPEDGPQRWQLQEAFIAVSRLSAAIAVKAHDKISIGAGISYVFGLGSLRRVQDFAAVDALAEGLAADPLNQENDLGSQAPSSLRESEVFSRPIAFTDGVSHGVSFNVGLGIKPTDKVTIGLSYDHGSKLRLKGDFTLDMNDDFFTQDLASEGLQFPPLVEGDGELSFRLAKRIMGGVAYDVSPKLRIDTSLAFVFWSDLDAFRIRLDSPDLAQPALGLPPTTAVALARDWKNTVHAEVSARIRPDKKQRMLLSTTLGYHSSASPDSTVDVASPDGNRLLGAFGFGYQINERMGIMVDAEAQGILPRTVTNSDFDLGNGVYKLLLASSSVHLQVRFGKAPSDEAATPETGKPADPRPESAPEPDATTPADEDARPQGGADGSGEAAPQGGTVPPPPPGISPPGSAVAFRGAGGDGHRGLRANLKL